MLRKRRPQNYWWAHWYTRPHIWPRTSRNIRKLLNWQGLPSGTTLENKEQHTHYFHIYVPPYKWERIQLSLKLDWVSFPPQIIAHFATCELCPQTSFPLFVVWAIIAVANPQTLAQQTEYKEGRGERIFTRSSLFLELLRDSHSSL